MKLGVMSALFGGMGLDKALDYCARIGLEAIELPVGGWAGEPFFDARAMGASAAMQAELTAKIRDHGLALSALAVHGNPVHPDRARAQRDHELFDNAVAMAPKLGTRVVTCFSGCPGGWPGDRYPNWVAYAWPTEAQEILRYQWDEVLVPYWAKQAQLANQHGVRIAWEAHAGFSVYNTDTLLSLSEKAMDASGVKGEPVLGANLDPSHLFWQGMDPVHAARVLGEAGLVFHVHAKDTELDRVQGPLNGYLDARPYADLAHRSWTFRTVGYGHGEEFWKPFISMLKRTGYDGVVSIEHEDPLMSVEEGLEKAVAFLRPMIIRENAGKLWWTEKK